MTTKFAPANSTILTAADPGWDQARRAWNLAVDQQPAAIARPASAQDVVAAVAYARRHGLRVAAQGTGHNAAPLGPLSGTILLKTEAMRQVSIDPGADDHPGRSRCPLAGRHRRRGPPWPGRAGRFLARRRRRRLV